MAENALVRLFGREAATRRRNELSQAFAPKSTPIRDRISAHRQQVDATLGGTTLQNRLAMLGSTGVPVLSDVAGLAADAMGYAGDPSSRTPVNYGLSALGLLPFVPGMTAYHGTPHRFAPEPDAPLGKFRMEKLGTGEGAQAYGHGMYFAERPEVAGVYQRLGAYEVDLGGGEKYKATNLLANRNDPREKAYQYLTAAMDAQSSNPFAHASKMIRQLESGSTGNKAIDVLADWQGKGAQVVGGGSLYHVDIPDEQIDQMLDWDKPLSEQPESVRGSLRDITDSIEGNGYFDEWLNATDGDYRDLWNNVLGETLDSSEISAQLAKRGIPGIRYLDGGSRGNGAPTGGKGTRNFVVFEPEKLKVLKRE